jgi:N-acetylmuramoyl-L-alanine amidase
MPKTPLVTTTILLLLALITACNTSPTPPTSTSNPTDLSALALRTANAAVQAEFAKNGQTMPPLAISKVIVTPQQTIFYPSAQFKASQIYKKAQERLLNDVANALEGKVARLAFAFAPATAMPTGPNINPQEVFACSGAPRPDFANPRPLPTTLAGTKVMLNPGHGYGLRDSGAWNYERPQINPGAQPPVYVQEDQNNLEVAMRVATALQAGGANVESARNLNQSAGTGVSGLAKWQESAQQHLKATGVAATVWNSEGNPLGSDCTMGKDLRSRPFYANHWGADVLVGLHSNANDNSSARGTWIIYTTVPSLPNTPSSFGPESARLANIVGNSIVAEIRAARPDLNWPAPRFVDEEYGEVRFAKMPAVLVEVGFHTNPTDGPALADNTFRNAVGQGISKAIKSFVGDNGVTPPPQPLPAPMLLSPGTTTAPGPEINSASLVVFAWNAVAGANRYGLYISKYPYGAANVVYSNETLTSTSLSLASNQFRSLGEQRYRWNMTTFHNTGPDDNGAFAPALNFQLLDPAPIPNPPAWLTLTMSAQGRVFLAWPEVAAATGYAFTATFDGVVIDAAGRINPSNNPVAAGTARFTDRADDPNRAGKPLCIGIQTITASASSAFSPLSCVTYRYLDIVLQGSGPASSSTILLRP